MPGVDAGDEPTGHPLLRLGPAEAHAGRRHGRVAMKASQAAREGVDVRGAQRAGGEALAPERAVGKASHPHGEVDHGSRAVQGRPARAVAHLDDIEVQLRRQAAVEAQLFLAEAAPVVECREVEKGQAHGLLDLVGLAGGQKHPGDVGLDQAHGRLLASLEPSTQGVDASARNGLRFHVDVHGRCWQIEWRAIDLHQVPPRRTAQDGGPLTEKVHHDASKPQSVCEGRQPGR